MEIRNPLVPRRSEEYRLAEKLRDLRAYRGLTQRQVAEAAGIDESTVRNYELARRTPKPEHVPGLARALEVMPEALVLFDAYPDANETLRLIWTLVDSYGFTCGHVGDRGYVAPGREFFSVGMSRWLYAYREMRRDEEGYRQNYELWKDEFHDHFNKGDYPDIYPAYDPVDLTAAQRWESDRFAAALKAEREAKGMTQADLAEASGVSMYTLRSYEQGKRMPREGQLDAIREALGLNGTSLTYRYLGSPNQAMHHLFSLAKRSDFIPDVVEGIGPALTANSAFIEWALVQLSDEIKVSGERCGGQQEEAVEHWLNTFDAYEAAEAPMDYDVGKPKKCRA